MSLKKVSVIVISFKLLLSLVILIPNNAMAFLSIYVAAVSAMFEESLSLQYGISFLALFILHLIIICLYAFLKGKASSVFGAFAILLLVGDTICQILFYLKDAYIFSGVVGIVFDIFCIALLIFSLRSYFKKQL